MAALCRRAESAGARQLGIAERIEWHGARSQPEVLAAYRDADIFVLAAKVAADGDQDGLPNVLIEAQSQGLACVATRLSGIPELIEHAKTGLLAPPGDPPALAAALERLISDPRLRRQLGQDGERLVRAAFDADRSADELAEWFGLELPAMVRAAE